MMYRITLLACAIAASVFGSSAATCGGKNEPCGPGNPPHEPCMGPGGTCNKDTLGCNPEGTCVPCKDKFETCGPHDVCCGDSECYEGKCLPTVCIPPEVPEPEEPEEPEAPPPLPFPECPAPNEGKGTIKFCVEDLDNAKPGQATCGTPTCNALCEYVCGDEPGTGDYTPDMCNNSGGGNCKGVIAPSGVDFKGGPCCGCVVEKACPELLE